VKIIWQFAWILPQASSNPFLTACQNVFDGEEWIVKAIVSGSCAAAGPQASASATALV
jgi:hypothetical protein